MTGLSRAGYYRWRLPPPATPVAMELRSQLQQVAVEWPAYGYRRITAELKRRGFEVNHKHVLRLMREDNLLCLRRRSFVVTTDSCHNLPVYANLARDIRPEAINQLWIADITYIRLRAEFVYLAVVLDAFSRRVIGWALGRTLEAKLAVSALRMAIEQRKPAAGLVHHSDRGVQYASSEYTGLLQQHLAQISMSRRGNFPLFRQNGFILGAGCARPRPLPAAESALGLRSRSALSSTQVLPEWTTSTSPCNNLLSNGDNPLNSLSHSKGSLHKSLRLPFPTLLPPLGGVAPELYQARLLRV
jgi:hypothetical protein